MTQKIGVVSLGCPKNLVDSETMLGLIKTQKYQIVQNPAEANIIIVNTCGFIESAKEESINTILEMGEYKKTGNCQYLVVSGCLGQRYANELFAELPEVDAIIGTEVYPYIADILLRLHRKERFICLQMDAPQQISCTGTVNTRVLTTPKYTAYLKIAEGCDNCCSYCVIPRIRGFYRSRPLNEVLEEAKYLVQSGVKELIIIAQDTTCYGLDTEGKLLLPTLLRELSKISDLKWIRVMYCYPNNFTDELIEAFAELDKVCKYIDLPLQHASDAVLYAMNRHDTQAEITALLTKIKHRIPDICIRTTFMVGFPGETDEDFQELLSFVKTQRFDNAGVFSFSPEEDTVAYSMENQIPKDIKEQRFHELMSLQAKISEEIHIQSEDKILEVLVEGRYEDNDSLYCGRSYKEAPDIDGTIYIETATTLEPGSFVKVRIEQGFTYETVGTLA